jgi:6-phospho-3-hexuloisomerase
VIELPAQTMADDSRAATSMLPMGSLYEVVQLLFFDVVSLRLRERLGQGAEEMRARHTNLE